MSTAEAAAASNHTLSSPRARQQFNTLVYAEVAP